MLFISAMKTVTHSHELNSNFFAVVSIPNENILSYNIGLDGGISTDFDYFVNIIKAPYVKLCMWFHLTKMFCSTNILCKLNMK